MSEVCCAPEPGRPGVDPHRERRALMFQAMLDGHRPVRAERLKNYWRSVPGEVLALAPTTRPQRAPGCS